MNLNNYFAILFIVLSFASTITNTQNRIVGGRDCDIMDSPYAVSIHIDGNYRCVGTIITLKKVLTSDSCLIGYDASRITIRAGVTDYRDAAKVRTAKYIIRPTDIYPSMVDMDLAVIFFDERLREGLKIQTVSLCDTVLNPGVKLQVVGWGSKNAQVEEYCPVLQSAEFEVIPNEECQHHYRSLYAVQGKHFPSTLICLKDREMTSDACCGDSGAPAIYNGKLCAVVSGGIRWLNPRYPTLYTSIKNNIVQDFIQRAMVFRLGFDL